MLGKFEIEMQIVGAKNNKEGNLWPQNDVDQLVNKAEK